MKCSVRIGCWNVQGVKNITDDSLFEEFIYKHDVVVLTETWLAESPNLFSKDFYNYHNMRPLNARAKRPSGGISILVRHDLKKIISKGFKIVKEHDCFIWLKIDKFVLGTSDDLYICATYIPPSESTYWSRHDYDPFDTLEQDVLNYNSKGGVFLVGDFNARTGTKHDFSPDFLVGEEIEDTVRQSDNILLDNTERKYRNNNDNKINSYGNKLLTICRVLNLRILNGRTLGDSGGAFTCFQHNGSSTVDYGIVSESFFNHMTTFQVSPPTHVSDHSYISCSLKTFHSILSPSIGEVGRKTLLKFKWDDYSQTNFKSALQLPHIRNKLEELANENFPSSETGTNQLCEKLTSVITEVARISLKSIHKKNKKQSHKLGFDFDCTKLKQKVLSLGKLVKKFPKDPIIRGTFMTTKKMFKKVVRSKYKEAKNKILEQIMNCEKANPKKFWKLLDELKDKKNKKNESPIGIS